MRMIKLIQSFHDGRSTSTVKAPGITQTMIEAAEDLAYTLITGKRPGARVRAKIAAKARAEIARQKTAHADAIDRELRRLRRLRREDERAAARQIAADARGEIEPEAP